MIEQITVFLENSQGRLTGLCRTVANAGVDMIALTIADTAEYGVVRIVCSDPQKAADALTEAGFRAVRTQVLAVDVAHRPGGLAELLETIDGMGLNIEYGYCFSYKGQTAIGVLKIKDAIRAKGAIAEAGYKLVSLADLV